MGQINLINIKKRACDNQVSLLNIASKVKEQTGLINICIGTSDVEQHGLINYCKDEGIRFMYNKKAKIQKEIKEKELYDLKMSEIEEEMTLEDLEQFKKLDYSLSYQLFRKYKEMDFYVDYAKKTN